MGSSGAPGAGTTGAGATGAGATGAGATGAGATGAGATGAGATGTGNVSGSSGGGTGLGGGGAPPAGGGGTTSGGGAGTADGGAAGGAGGMGGDPDASYHDPGTGAFEVVPQDQVQSVCKLDPAKLMAAAAAGYPWLVVRYGKVCWQSGADTFPPAEAWSTTKTLGATVAGEVSYETRMIPRTGKKTGQFLDTDMALDWLSAVTYNQQAKVAHVLAMVAHDPSLAQGSKTFAYDTVGTTEINTISDMMNAAIAQDTARLGANVEEFTKKYLYTPLGMTKSTWTSGSPNKVLAYSWTTDLYDMARVGLLINHYGWYGGARHLDHQWVYRQTHPAFEDSNTSMGYLTWLNSASNWCSIDGIKKQGAYIPGTCAPVALHNKYPHGVSESPDCGYSPPYTCDQKYDVGVWQAEGLGGQLIQGHRGLDMVIVARNAQPGGAGPGTAKTVWDLIRPAVIAGDPMFKGDETAFCTAYGGNNYAPDLH